MNSGYEPLLVMSWQRAIGLQVSEKVEVVEVYEAFVRSPSIAMLVPAVVKLHRHVRFRPPGVRFNRRNVFVRDGFRCQYCGHGIEPGHLTLDHVIPRNQGGGTTWDNIVSCCERCNRSKGGRTPDQAGMSLIRTPVRPRWVPTGRDGLIPSRVPAEWRDYLLAA